LSSFLCGQPLTLTNLGDQGQPLTWEIIKDKRLRGRLRRVAWGVVSRGWGTSNTFACITMVSPKRVLPLAEKSLQDSQSRFVQRERRNDRDKYAAAQAWHWCLRQQLRASPALLFEDDDWFLLGSTLESLVILRNAYIAFQCLSCTWRQFLPRIQSGRRLFS
jgi:hypothetical protein